MGLNIKNERVCALAREAAARSGQSQTSAIESALEAYLETLADGDRAQARRREAEERERRRLVGEIVDSFHQAPVAERSVEAILDDLYDPATGLPR